MGGRLLISAAAGMFAAGVVSASDTAKYSYDALGRLVTTTVEGGQADGSLVETDYDPAGNRLTHNVAGTSGSAPTFSVSPATAIEGSTVAFTIHRSGNVGVSASVDYATVAGTAKTPADFAAVSGTASFAPSEISKTVSVSTVNDALIEGTETFTLNLSGASAGSVIPTASAVGTISDNDGSAPSFAVGNASVVEGAPLVFTVTKTGSAATTYSVNYGSAASTATSGSDFTATSGTLAFLASETSKTISLATIDDAVVEGSETAKMNLSAPTGGATITVASGTGTITDNDSPSPPSFAIADAAARAEGGVLSFVVTKTGTTTSTYSVSYATANGTATSGSDFTGASGTLTFLAGDTTKTVNVSTTDDSSIEPDETVLVNLSAPSGGSTITDSQAVGTITNNDFVNQPPQPVSDNAGSIVVCGSTTYNVVSSDTDPENNVPLSLVSAAGSRGIGVTVDPNSTTSVIIESRSGTGSKPLLMLSVIAWELRHKDRVRSM